MSIYSSNTISPLFTGIGPVIPKEVHDKIGYNKFTTEEYLASSGAEKLGALWNSIVETEGSEGAWPGVKLAGIFIEPMNPTFAQAGDVFKQGLFGQRTKYIHSVGAHGKVTLNSFGNHPFTGIFQGADKGIVRLSSAAKPEKGTKAPLGPGMGLKFLRDGMDSANLVAMYSVNGQPSEWNFFEHEFKNHIAPASGAALNAVAFKFSQATDWI